MRSGSAEIRACGLVPYPLDTAPSQRYRFEQWQPYLRASGISLDLFPSADNELTRILYKHGRGLVKAVGLGKAFLRGFGRLMALRRYDVVLVHRAICIGGPALLERLLRLVRRPVVFDFDDAIYRLHASTANRHFGWLKFPGKTAAICRLSDHVTVGNEFLAEYARRHNPRVTVIPTSIDTDRYCPLPPKLGPGPTVIGWTGSSTSQTYLESFSPVLRPILARSDVVLRVLSDRKPELGGLPFEWRCWTPQSEAEEVGSFDIGIMPTPDDPWARGKCAFKALQYMAMAIPAVCSPVGMNAEVVRHGVNGFLASTPDDWLTYLTILIKDRSLRNELGGQGRRTVEQRFSMRQSAAAMAEVLREVARARRT